MNILRKRGRFTDTITDDDRAVKSKGTYHHYKTQTLDYTKTLFIAIIYHLYYAIMFHMMALHQE